MFSGQARATRGILGIRPRPLGRGVTCALFKVQLSLFYMHSCRLSASVHKFCFSFVLFFLTVQCLIFAADLCLPGCRLLPDVDSDSALPTSCRRSPAGDPSTARCWSGVPWRWRHQCRLAVRHYLVAPTLKQPRRLDRHACGPLDGILCIGCCSDMQRLDDLSPST